MRANQTDSTKEMPFFFIALFFVLIKLFTWGIGYILATSFPIDSYNYFKNFHHLRVDNRAINGEIRFFNLWNYADSEWYLSIAQDGYPSKNQLLSDRGSNYMFKSTIKESHRRYAFFPLYPFIIRIFRSIYSLEAAAFTATLLINAVAIMALLHLIKLYFPEKEPIGPFLLLMLFPFSIFYSLYFPEALFLLLSLLVFIFLKSQKYILMTASGLLLTVARPHGVFITLPVLLHLFLNKEKKVLPYLSIFAIPAGLLLYLVFGYFQTGIWNFYSDVIKMVWRTDFSNIQGNLIRQATLVLNFWQLPLHSIHQSKIDTLVMLSFGIILVLMSLSKFPWELTIWSTLIWVIPLVAKNDLMSFSRYMSVSFPVFIFLGFTNKKIRYALLVLFTVGYGWALKTVIQYGWLG